MLFHKIYGGSQGDFRTPRQPEQVEPWQQAMRTSVLGGHTFRRMHIMRPNCTTQCVLALPETSDELMPSVFRTKEICDGLITNEFGVALGVANADCPVAIVHDQDAPKLGFLHCALNSLVQKDGSIGIFQAFFELHGFDRTTVKVHLGYGIDKCCYGLDWLPECHKNALVTEFPTSVATDGPEKDKVSIDLFALMRAQLRELGLQGGQILRIADPPCTACAKIDGQSAFHSNLYDRTSKKRNLVMAWMQPKL